MTVKFSFQIWLVQAFWAGWVTEETKSYILMCVVLVRNCTFTFEDKM